MLQARGLVSHTSTRCGPIFDLRGQNETKHNRIFILLLQWITVKKTPDHKGEKHL